MLCAKCLPFLFSPHYITESNVSAENYIYTVSAVYDDCILELSGFFSLKKFEIQILSQITKDKDYIISVTHLLTQWRVESL